MKRARSRQPGKGGLDLIDEAAHLLRAASSATLATYYLGAIPFVLGFLYFWTDMSRSPFANQHLAEAALATTALFIWMKFCQASFARRIRAQLAAEPMPRWSFRQTIRVLLTQAVIQPSGLFLIPLSLVLTLPFAWVYAFYQSVTAMADADSSESSKLVKRAWKQTALWTWQNHIGLIIALVFGVCVFLNWAMVAFSVPSLLKMLFGVESSFSKSPAAMLNTSFLATIFGLTYLCVDPILKTVYALRCFYGESLQSGEDLKAELKQFTLQAWQVGAVLLFAFTVAAGVSPAATLESPATISPPALDRAIQ